jgi:phosphatidate cytidylyltransferase
VNRPVSPSSVGRGRLASRLVAGATVLAAFSAFVWADATGLAGAPPPAWLLPVVVVLAAGAAHEVVRLASAAGVQLGPFLVPAGAVAIATSPAVFPRGAPSGDPPAVVGAAAVACMAVVFVTFTVGVARYAPGARAVAGAAGSIAAAVSIGLPFAFMVALRLVATGAASTTATASLVPIISLIAVVKAGDIAAYAVGSAVGRHRMAPTLSPGKTWEGCVASLAASVAAAWLVIERSGGQVDPRPLGGWLAFGLLVGMAGMVGDLSESLVKRDLGAKDSGTVLGGMGGCLDLVDSLLLAGPVAWLLWQLGVTR